MMASVLSFKFKVKPVALDLILFAIYAVELICIIFSSPPS